MNKYYQILKKVLADGKTQKGRKGESRYLLNETVTLSPAELLDIFEGHNIARKKLRSELSLFMSGERQVEKYREAGINWWDYCGSILVNSYPTYFEKLPPLIGKINRENEAARTTCCSSVRPARKATRHHASASYSSRSNKANWS